MLSFQEQISAASKSNIEAQLAMVSALSSKAFEGIEKFVELNLNTAKSALETSTSHAQQLLAAKDAQEFFALHAARTQPSADKFMAYGRSLMSIASGLQAEFAKATEAQINEHGRKLSSFADEISKSAPAGSENMVAFVKQAISNANAGYKQFSQVMEANMSNAKAQMSTAANVAGARISQVAAAKK